MNAAYYDIYERCAEDAAFLWVLRSLAVDQPHYTPNDVLKLDQRIESQLDALMSAPEEAWEICLGSIETEGPGEVFTTSVLAFRSLDVAKIQTAVEYGLATEESFKGLVSALGWLPGRLCHSWIKKFLTSKDLDHKYLALAVCSVRREDPGELLTNILQRSDCLAHDRLFARGLRLVGELKRRDLAPVLRPAIRSDHPDIAFWSSWSAVILGDRSALNNLQPVVMESNPHQEKAIQLAFRALPVEHGRKWISELARSPEEIRNVIKASGLLGDPHAVEWLIAQMRVPALSRLAGEAFTNITGIELETNGLAISELPDLDDQVPNDDPADDRVDMDEDEHLAFPDPYKVAAIWQKYQGRFVPAQRYLLGQPLNPAHVKRVLDNGLQRQRRTAAFDLALLQPDQLLANWRMKGES
ncbi:TIGR02270 family protein [Gilvimarinus sp. F26214L]|uniref:TIGR02270 family protein n=1 Tax=Gilvimarinus sp. DZF01 TaxID=3461371 RepID=UPI0040452883